LHWLAFLLVMNLLLLTCSWVPAAAGTRRRPGAPDHQRRLNWSDRYPWIVEAARKVRQSRFVLDGEAVVRGVDGISDFNALHSRQHDDEVQFCAFDILALDGDGLRKLPLSMRKTNLDRPLARRPEGVFINPFERGEIGPDLFRAACDMGLEGLVSKRRDRRYQGGRSKCWVKVKDRNHPAMDRVIETFR
jgi:bifunctional non-homologous end joining protein LigD